MVRKLTKVRLNTSLPAEDGFFMQEKEFINWLVKISDANLDPHKTFSLHCLFTSMRYLQEKNFTVNDFQEVFDDLTKATQAT